MEIIKTGVRNLDFSRMSLEEIRDYWKTLESDSLHQVLPSRLNLGYLCEVIQAIEKVEISTKDVEAALAIRINEKGQEIKVPFADWPNGHLDENLDFTTLDRPFGFSTPNLPRYVTAFSDITYVDLREDGGELEAYHTPEVLQVLKQWKAYLEKFEAENKASHE